MLKKCGVPVVGVCAALWILALGAPNALAAVTSSTVTAPASGTFFQQNTDNLSDPAHQITTKGTTTDDGTPGNVDLICTFGTTLGAPSDAPIAFNVPVTSDGGDDGSFTFSGAVPPIERPCVVRAVPAGGGLPVDLTPFTGPTIAAGDFDTTSVSGGANDGLTYDFFDNDAQFSGDADYQSVGDGGLFDASPADPSTLVEGADLFFSDDYLSDGNTDRSDIEVDGLPAYAAFTAEHLLKLKGADFSGLPAVTFTQSQDPSTGDVTIHESELLVLCAPTPATYPATASSCTSFASSGVRFDRTIVQGQDGRQAQITDTYTSVDGKQHAVDLRYAQDFQNAGAGFNFPWVDGATFKTHVAGNTVAAPPSAPVSMFVAWQNGAADGAQTSAQGAITFAQKPSSLAFVTNGGLPFGATHLDVSFTRTVAAGSSATLKTTYSWAFTKADAQSLATIAEHDDAIAPAATTGAATAITTTGATVAGSVNPNGSDTKYQFQYGTSTSYDNSTTLTDAGAGTSSINASATLSGLQPGTTYHYRLVATNTARTTDGSDATFTTASPPPPPPPPPTKLKVGKVKVKGDVASIPLSCTGAATAVCKGTVSETIRVAVRVKHHRKTVTETVASGRYSVRAGAAKTVKLTLNKKGRKALAASSSHKLRVTLTVRLASKKVTSRTLTFKQAHKHKPHGKTRHKG